MRLTSPLWYLAAFLLAIGGWMASAVVAAGAWDHVRDATLQNLTERVDAKGASLAVFTDVRQPERDVTCTATGPAKGAEPVTLEDAPIDLRVPQDGSTWYLIAFEREGSDQVAVRCTPKDRAADAATYRVAVADGFLDRTRNGAGIAWIAAAVAVALALATWWTRRKRTLED
ncbi:MULTISPECIES: hypothetical protein [Aeromicrobium]|uniref:Uncharacterized protein n=1 Tax=Aeromicrobium erythreum TaxID=2041 RepID=A0A0U4BD59_9ACTN|nr:MULTISPECIES: hypothetical protein [Aeromicrobium]ALX03313.1 hypothetical protein AERYTH_00655 [Aeromicrobium erythreum]